MKRQWGCVTEGLSGIIRMRIVVPFCLLTGLFFLGCQTQSPSVTPAPKKAFVPQTRPSEVPQPSPIEPEKRPVAQEKQSEQPQPAVAQARIETPTSPTPSVGPVPKEGGAISPGAGSATVNKTNASAGPTGGVILPQGQTPLSGGPKIVIEKAEFDMGEISTNSIGMATFKWTNTGDATLTITDVRKCCGANVQLEKQKLEPGESGGLKVEYSTGRDAGQFKKQLTVLSNDPGNPAVTLNILGKVVQRLTWKPTQLKLFMNKENLGGGDIVLTALDGKPFSIKGYLCTGECITIEYDPNVQATEFVLKPKVHKEKLQALDYPKGTLQIKLTRQDYEVVSVPFDLLPNYAVIPTNFLLFNAEPGKKETRKITILDNYVGEDGQADFTIDSVTSKNKMISVTTTKKTKGGFELVLEINPAAPKEGDRSFDDEVFIKIKEGEKLEVTLRGFYSARALSNAGSMP